MSSTPVMPSWFAVYPEFDVGVARECVYSVESFRSMVCSVREQILGVEELLRRDGEGAWLEEYSRQAKHVWYWLGDVSVALSRLAGSIEEVMSEAYRATYRKETAWADIQRYIHPLSENIVPVSASVALRDYACFKTGEYPLTVPYLETPYNMGVVIDSAVSNVAGAFCFSDAVGADTDALYTASNIWHGTGQHYQRVMNAFEDATQTWARHCAVFSPADFTSLLESLYCFPRIAIRHAERLAETAQRFNETQEDIMGLFGWSAFSYSAWLTRHTNGKNPDTDFASILTATYGLSPQSAQTIADLEQAINQHYPNASQTYRNWLLTRTLAHTKYNDFQWDQTAGKLPLSKYVKNEKNPRASHNELMSLDDFVTTKLGIESKKWQELTLELRVHHAVVKVEHFAPEKSVGANLEEDVVKDLRKLYKSTNGNYEGFEGYVHNVAASARDNDIPKADFLHMMATTSSHYALQLDKTGNLIPYAFNGGKAEAVEYSGFMGDAVLLDKKKNEDTQETYFEVSFGEDDYLSDLDAENIAGRSLANNLPVSQAMNTYYADITKDSTIREKEFVARYGGFDELVGKVFTNALSPDLASYGFHKTLFSPIEQSRLEPNDTLDLPDGAIDVYTPPTDAQARLKEMEKLNGLAPTVEQLRRIQTVLGQN